MNKDVYEAGLINSSYTFFFHIIAVLYAPFFARVFPDELYLPALVSCLLVSIGFFWGVYFLMANIDSNIILKSILYFAGITAAMRVADAIIGPIDSSQIPVINVQIIGPYAYSSAATSPVFVSLFFFYGLVNYFWAMFLALLAETIYGFASRLLQHSTMMKILIQLDAKIDKTASSLHFFEILPMRQTIGAIAVLSLITGYGVLYVMLQMQY